LLLISSAIVISPICTHEPIYLAPAKAASKRQFVVLIKSGQGPQPNEPV
jgi:hypothetical protein